MLPPSIGTKKRRRKWKSKERNKKRIIIPSSSSHSNDMMNNPCTHRHHYLNNHQSDYQYQDQHRCYYSYHPSKDPTLWAQRYKTRIFYDDQRTIIYNKYASRCTFYSAIFDRLAVSNVHRPSPSSSTRPSRSRYYTLMDQRESR